ncbi:intra-Golgi vesicle-mediated transport protein [Malassezia pachydermatis]
MSDFASALRAWRSVHFDDVQKELQNYIPTVQERQKDALLARKALSERTKEFRRLTPEVQLNEIRTLVKAYQMEIDALTTRAKSAESLLEKTQSQLQPAPNPYPILEALVDTTIQAQEASELRAEMARIQASASEWEAKCKEAEARAEEASQDATAAVAQAEKRVNEAWHASTHEQETRVANLQRELHKTQAQLRELRSSHDDVMNQLMSKQDASQDTAHIDSLLEDLQHAKDRAAQAERRVKAMREEYEQQQAHERAHLSEQLAEKEAYFTKQLEAQTDQLRELTFSHEAELAATKQQRDAIEQHCQDAEAELTRLKESMAQYDDYDTIKRELHVYRAMDLTDEEASAQATDNTLEISLARKNQKLQDELAGMRTALADAKREQEATQQSLAEKHARIADLEALTSRLEADLLGVASSPNGPATAPKQEETSAATDLLPIVTNQRDRFRSRNAELEEDLKKQAQATVELRAEIKRLQSDNVGLYEKVRYLQGYANQRGGSANDMPYPPTSHDTREDMYRARYEASINPFQAFRGQVCMRFFNPRNIRVQSLPLARSIDLCTYSLAPCFPMQKCVLLSYAMLFSCI